MSEFKKLPPPLIGKAFATHKHVIGLIERDIGYNDYVKNRSALHSGVWDKFVVRENGAVSSLDIFEMATYGERFCNFFEDPL